MPLEKSLSGKSQDPSGNSKLQSNLSKDGDEIEFDYYTSLATLYDTYDIRCPEHLRIYESPKYKKQDEKRAVQ
jgi:hypothetical protein